MNEPAGWQHKNECPISFQRSAAIYYVNRTNFNTFHILFIKLSRKNMVFPLPRFLVAEGLFLFKFIHTNNDKKWYFFFAFNYCCSEFRIQIPDVNILFYKSKYINFWDLNYKSKVININTKYNVVVELSRSSTVTSNSEKKLRRYCCQYLSLLLHNIS